MSKFPRRRLAVGVGCVLVLTAAVTVSLSSASAGSFRRQSAQKIQQRWRRYSRRHEALERLVAAEHHALSADLKAHFAILRMRIAADGVGARASNVRPGVATAAPASLPNGILAIATESNDPINTPFALAPQSARLVSTSGIRFWVVPGAGGSCVFEAVPAAIAGHSVTSMGGGECNSTANVDDYGNMASAQTPAGVTVLFGIVPDGNSNVVFATTSGPRVVPAPEGVFVTPAAGIADVTVDGTAGAVTWDPVP
jgi:hypothetical protein